MLCVSFFVEGGGGSVVGPFLLHAVWAFGAACLDSQWGSFRFIGGPYMSLIYLVYLRQAKPF